MQTIFPTLMLAFCIARTTILLALEGMLNDRLYD
jgi:hypothetical protein